jgi:hypothetical protein
VKEDGCGVKASSIVRGRLPKAARFVRPLRLLLGTFVLLGFLVACGETGSNVAASRRKQAAELSNPPLPLRQGLVLQSVGSRYLFALEGEQAALFDQEAATWKAVPSPPLRRAAYGESEGSRVVAVGLRCDDACIEGKTYNVAAAALDVASGEPTWTTSDLNVEVRDPEFFSPAMIGQVGESFVVGTGNELFALSERLEKIDLAEQPTSPVLTCVAGDSLQSLVQTPEAQGLPLEDPAALVDPVPNHTIAIGHVSGPIESLRWELAPNGSTAGLKGASAFFTGVVCGPRGVALLLGDQMYEFDGTQWLALPPLDLAPYGMSGSGVTEDGRLVLASGNRVAVLNDSEWQVSSQSQKEPPGIQIATLGREVVVYEAPRSKDDTGVIRGIAP